MDEDESIHKAGAGRRAVTSGRGREAARPAGVYNSGLRADCAASFSSPVLSGRDNTVSTFTLSDFDYDLPPELIAQTPAAERAGSRLLHLDGQGKLHDRQFPDLLALLRPHDLLVFNDTRVIKARLAGQKATGGKVEVLVERITEPTRALAHVRASKSPGPGMRLELAGGAVTAEVLGRQGELFDLRFAGPVLDLLEAHGATPLPPYITHAAEHEDEQRYQTVYAREPAPWPRPRRACISTRPCWSAWPPAACSAPS